MTPNQRDRLAEVLRRPGMPAAGDHARLMLRIADRPRPMSTTEERRVACRAADILWAILTVIVLSAAAMLAERGGLS